MSFRAWGPKQNPIYALSVGDTQVDNEQPTGFATGGDQVKIYNSGATQVIVGFYAKANTKPTLAFPSSGNSLAPPPLCFVTVVPAGAEKQISMPVNADSFSAIGSAAGPSVIYVQRGDGST